MSNPLDKSDPNYDPNYDPTHPDYPVFQMTPEERLAKEAKLGRMFRQFLEKQLRVIEAREKQSSTSPTPTLPTPRDTGL